MFYSGSSVEVPSLRTALHIMVSPVPDAGPAVVLARRVERKAPNAAGTLGAVYSLHNQCGGGCVFKGSRRPGDGEGERSARGSRRHLRPIHPTVISATATVKR